MSSAIEIFGDVIQIAEALMEVKSSMHEKNIVESLEELEEKAIGPIKDLCKKIAQLLHFHIGQGEQKMSELEGALNIGGAKKLLAKHEQLIAKGDDHEL
jgi:hypothetical protein